ncbi:MAG: hypothetical protein AVDCRST_MAG67-2509, partial [uncultured Solirubrobacteraceae bacterium]
EARRDLQPEDAAARRDAAGHVRRHGRLGREVRPEDGDAVLLRRRRRVRRRRRRGLGAATTHARRASVHGVRRRQHPPGRRARRGAERVAGDGRRARPRL